MTRRIWVALWHGGNSYAAPYADDAELFPSLRAAADAVRSRRDTGYSRMQVFRYAFRQSDCAFTPCAHDDGSGGMHLFGPFESLPDDFRQYMETDGYPDRIIEFGPRGGIRIARA